MVRGAPADGLVVSGGAYATVRDCKIDACGGRGCVVLDHASLVAHNSDWSGQRGGTLYAGDSAQVTMTRCHLDGPSPPPPKAAQQNLPKIRPLSLPTFLKFKMYVRRIRWQTRDLQGMASCYSGHGMMLFGEAKLWMEHCFVRWAPGSGLVATQNSSCVANSVEILQSGEEGVLASGDAQLTMKNVTIDDARHSGCLMVENASVGMTGCTVQQCSGVGVLTTGSSQLTAQDSTMQRNDCDGVRAKGYSSLTLHGCIIKGNGLDAVRVASYGSCKIVANQLLGTTWTDAPPDKDGAQDKAYLRNAILAAIEDGDVDKKELEKIMRSLKSAKVDEEKQKQVSAQAICLQYLGFGCF